MYEDTNQELTADQVTKRLDVAYTELKTLKPYLPYQQIKRVLAELKWIKSMRKDGVFPDQDTVEEAG